MTNAPFILRRLRRGGFTLLELILVLAILSIFAAVAAPQLAGSLGAARVGKGTEQVFAAAREARAHAALRGLRVRLAFDFETRTYWNEEEADPLGTPGEWTKMAGREEKPYELPDGVTVAGLRLNDEEVSASGRAEILFRPDGTADDARITLANNSGDRRTIEIRGATGHVRILTDEEAEELAGAGGAPGEAH